MRSTPRVRRRPPASSTRFVPTWLRRVSQPIEVRNADSSIRPYGSRHHDARVVNDALHVGAVLDRDALDIRVGIAHHIPDPCGNGTGERRIAPLQLLQRLAPSE